MVFFCLLLISFSLSLSIISYLLLHHFSVGHRTRLFLLLIYFVLRGYPLLLCIVSHEVVARMTRYQNLRSIPPIS